VGRASVRAWIPATVVAMLIVAGLTAAVVLPRHPAIASASPTPSPDLHSKAAVIAAVKNYYQVETAGRRAGDASLIDTVSTGPGSLVSQNFRTFIAEQGARGKRSVILQTYFADWKVTVAGDTAVALYTSWLRGHDVSASTGQPLEADTETSKGAYKMTLRLEGGRWRAVERDLLRDNAT
jgi:hypothetical protein